MTEYLQTAVEVVGTARRRGLQVLRGGGSGAGEPGSGARGRGGRGEGDRLSSSTLAVLLILGSITMLFALVISSYMIRMDLPDWRPTPVPGVLWVSTSLLAAASLILERARSAARADRPDQIGRHLLAAGVVAILFVGAQLTGWMQLVGAGYGPAANPSSAFFYLLTALHGLHVFGGLVALARVGRAVRSWDETRRRAVDLCGWYWHFLLVVWIVLFALILWT